MNTVVNLVRPYKYPEKKLGEQVLYSSELIQMDVENSLHLFLNTTQEHIKNIVVVGAWRGEEVDSFLQYPNANIFCFEPNPSNFLYLKTKFENQKRVYCFPFAIGSENKKIELYESNITGNDSCLPIIDSTRIHTKVKHITELRTLDTIAELKNKEIDLLWIDVQGYELEVLKGATHLLTSCKSVFSEVGTNNPDYQGAVSYETIIFHLQEKNFAHAAEGVTTDKNEVLSGNAYFIKNTISLQNDIFTKFEERIKQRFTREIKRRKILGSKYISFLSKYIPIRMKIWIKKILSL